MKLFNKQYLILNFFAAIILTGCASQIDKLDSETGKIKNELAEGVQNSDSLEVNEGAVVGFFKVNIDETMVGKSSSYLIMDASKIEYRLNLQNTAMFSMYQPLVTTANQETFFFKKVSAGKYRITNFMMGGIPSNLMINSFEVKPGQVIYLGNITLTVPPKIGNGTAFKRSITNETSKVSEIFSKEYPNLNKIMKPTSEATWWTK